MPSDHHVITFVITCLTLLVWCSCVAGIAADKATTGYTHVVLEESPRLYCHILASGRRRDSWPLVSAAASALADGALRAQQCIAGEGHTLCDQQKSDLCDSCTARAGWVSQADLSTETFTA